MAFPTIDADYADRNDFPSPGHGKGVQAVTFTATLGTADLAVNRVARVGILPSGFTIHGGYIEVDDLDTGTAAIVFDMGVTDPDDSNNDDADLFADGETTAQAGGKLTTFESAAYGYTTPAEMGVTFEVKTAADTAAAGDVSITILGHFA
jgi:hypothetical protein